VKRGGAPTCVNCSLSVPMDFASRGKHESIADNFSSVASPVTRRAVVPYVLRQE
jgi:hypothetical protein